MLQAVAQVAQDTLPPIRFFGDRYDIGLYYEWSRWAVGEGRLYSDVHSDYPLLGNALFGIVRFLTSGFADRPQSFYIGWIITGFLGYAAAVWLAARDRERRDWLGMAMWLAPAPIYFSLFRYDIFPALATFLALFAMRRKANMLAAVWLGFAVALKGYALFVLPAFAYYVFARDGFRAACKASVIAIAPFALSFVIVLLLTDQQGVKSPFQYWFVRGANGESTYDAFFYLIRNPMPGDMWGFTWIGRPLQAAFSLLAFAMRPRTFPQLVNAFLVAMLGFVGASIWYSPQWLLWFLPMLYFSAAPALRWIAVAMGWLTYLYFPVIWDRLYQQRRAFKLIVIVITALRTGALVLAIRELWRRSDERAPAATA